MKLLSNHDNHDLNRNRGITLTELIVASVMIGIVMVGVSSFGLTIKSLQGSTNKSVILSMKAKTVMARMSDDAYAVVGDVINPGFAESPGVKRSLCFRHDVNNTIADYTDDDWTCYYRDPQNVLSLCTVPAAPANVPPNNAVQCDGAGTRTELLNMTQADFYDVVGFFDGPDFRLEYFDIHINARYNDDPTIAMDPITNPEYFVSTKISPPAQSR